MLGRPCLPRRGGQGNVPYTISVCLDTDSTMPISPSSINKLVPPDEKNGRLMPVFGIVFVTTAMFRIACSVTCTTNPTTSSAPNLSRARTAIDMPRKSSSKNSVTTAAGTGELAFADLTPGNYRLTETKTAEGYTLLSEAIEFTLTADGQCRRGDETFGKITPGADGVYNIALTIYNRKGFTLPHTGADAPSLWLLIGLPALVAVLLVLVFRYKRGGKRS